MRSFPNSIVGSDRVLRSAIPDVLEGKTEEDMLTSLVGGNLGTHLVHLAELHALRLGDNVFMRNAYLEVIDKDYDDTSLRSLTYAQFANRTKLIANVFLDLGLKRGDIVDVSLPNSTEFMQLLAATWMCGGIFSAVGPDIKPKSMAAQIKRTDPRLVVCSQVNLSTIREALEMVGKLDTIYLLVVNPGLQEEEVVLGPQPCPNVLDLGKLMSAKNEQFSLEIRNEFQEGAVILWSSGTTGEPKGILLPHGLYITTMLAGIMERRGKKMPPFLLSTLFYHGSGLHFSLLALANGDEQHFLAGDTISEKVGTKWLFLAIEKLKPSAYLGGSHHICLAAATPNDQNQALNSVELVRPIGAKVPSDTFAKLKKVFPKVSQFPQSYGVTESGRSLISTSTPNCMGVVLPRVQVKIADQETAVALGAGQVGEILIKTGVSFLKYLGMPEETKYTYSPGDGFFKTGDLGYYDNDGTIYFIGRIKEVIKYHNCHTYPNEIETILLDHPGVAEVAVFGTPDPISQELVTAAIVRSPSSEVTEQELMDLVASMVDDYKLLRGGVLFVDALPRNSLGKVVKKKLVEMMDERRKNNK